MRVTVHWAPRGQAARAIVAYNGHAFDMRVLRQYYDGNDARWDAHVGKMHDPFAGVTRAAGRRVKLDTLLELNGLERKAGAGQDAPRWWAEGRLQQLEQYCARDVRALSELALRAQVYGVWLAKCPHFGNTAPLPAPIAYSHFR